MTETVLWLRHPFLHLRTQDNGKKRLSLVTVTSRMQHVTITSALELRQVCAVQFLEAFWFCEKMAVYYFMVYLMTLLVA
jgi:hypothetical protein